jgi:hypothetical protein
MTILKLVSKVDDTVLAAVEIRAEGVDAAKLELWKKIIRQLKLKFVEEED